MFNFSIIQKSQLEGAERIDPEYYQPEYLSAAAQIKRGPYKSLGELCLKITDGSHQTPAYQESGIPFLMVKNVREQQINFDQDISFISDSFDKTLKHCKPVPGDILLTKVGSVGISAVVPELAPNFNIFVSLAVLKDCKNIDKYFLSTFLNSRYGKFQAIRASKGISQPDLHLEDIREFLIPIFEKKIQTKISKNVISARDLFKKSQALYLQAENLLLDELKIKDFDDSEDLFYTISSKEIISSSRLDSQHFQPLVNKLIKIVSDKGGVSIGGIELFNKRGVQPSYTEDGEVEVITSKHLGSTSINYDNLDKTTIEEWKSNKTAQIQQYDTLIYTTGANIGRTNCYLENKKSLASNHINVLRVKQLNPIYLSVFLNSFLGKQQVNKFVTGSAQAELYPTDISKFVVWNAPLEIQKEIAELVIKSHEARKKSKELLEQAKRDVEDMIDSARSLRVERGGGD